MHVALVLAFDKGRQPSLEGGLALLVKICKLSVHYGTAAIWILMLRERQRVLGYSCMRVCATPVQLSLAHNLQKVLQNVFSRIFSSQYFDLSNLFVPPRHRGCFDDDLGQKGKGFVL